MSLLDGSAPAGLVADALQCALSPTPRTQAQRKAEAISIEVKELVETNPCKSGNLTAAMRLEQLDPAAAMRLRADSGVQPPVEKAAAHAAQQ